jgi:hypothetical protein
VHQAFLHVMAKFSGGAAAYTRHGRSQCFSETLSGPSPSIQTNYNTGFHNSRRDLIRRGLTLEEESFASTLPLVRCVHLALDAHYKGRRIQPSYTWGQGVQSLPIRSAPAFLALAGALIPPPQPSSPQAIFCRCMKKCLSTVVRRVSLSRRFITTHGRT